MDNGFDKSKHLCLEKNIELLFSEGKRVTCFPFRAVYRQREEGEGVKMMFVAQKKNFRHAVDRNRWKRMMREAYRVRQGILEGMDLDIAIMVIDNKMAGGSYVGQKMEELLGIIYSKTHLC
ncbi:MAG: ribonuclease P protein component [Paludibacteraceae bacterium]|nr:ribonuclease P protein component [Paludibacteraceae bacterium]